MLTMDDYGRIRRADCDGMSIHEMARRFYHSRSKTRQILRGESEPKPYSKWSRQSAPKPSRRRSHEILHGSGTGQSTGRSSEEIRPRSVPETARQNRPADRRRTRLTSLQSIRSRTAALSGLRQIVLLPRTITAAVNKLRNRCQTEGAKSSEKLANNVCTASGILAMRASLLNE